MTEHISCDCKCKFNSTVCNSDQKLNNKTCQWECKNYRACKNDYSWNPSTCICGNSKYLKSTSATECDEIISAMNNVSTRNTNITTTASIDCHTIKEIDYYILHTGLLAII